MAHHGTLSHGRVSPHPAFSSSVLTRFVDADHQESLSTLVCQIVGLPSHTITHDLQISLAAILMGPRASYRPVHNVETVQPGGCCI